MDLNVEPNNIIQNEQIFTSKSGIESYMATLYRDMRVDDFTWNPDNSSWAMWYTMADFTGEMTERPDQGDWISSFGNGNYFGWWNYNCIRQVNLFLDAFPIYMGNFPESQANHWLGEAYFIRAYYYFTMVKRYGGVPKIDKPLNADMSMEEMRIPRSKEEEIYRFIASDLDQAFQLMGETSTVMSRANKYTAAALKSRAMLYAGTIAKYGTVLKDGLQGIDASKAEEFLKSAYDAANSVVESRRYELHGNFGEYFGSAAKANKETILLREFKKDYRGHSFVSQSNNWSASNGYGAICINNPTLDLVEMFEYKNDANGALKFNDNSGNPIKYTNPLDIFNDKDERLAATVILPYSEYYGKKSIVRRGVYLPDGTKLNWSDDNAYARATTAGWVNDRPDASEDAGKTLQGYDGIGGGDRSATGFYLRKYTDESVANANLQQVYNENPFPTIRFAEMYLNMAEAVTEMTGATTQQRTNALSGINLLRERGGIPALSDAEMTRDRVRHERRVELALEFQSYWDLRRWRTYNELNNFRPMAIAPWFDMRDNGFFFEPVLARSDKGVMVWDDKLYYNMIPAGEISKNPNLIQNEGY
jgi:hypothetical protein